MSQDVLLHPETFPACKDFVGRAPWPAAAAANEFREALNGDLEPRWIEVWSHVNLGRIFDITGQRERAIHAYHLAQRTRDNSQGALEQAAEYLKTPYERKDSPPSTQ